MVSINGGTLSDHEMDLLKYQIEKMYDLMCIGQLLVTNKDMYQWFLMMICKVKLVIIKWCLGVLVKDVTDTK